MALSIPAPHDPDAVLDYSVTWADWLPEGDTIAESTWKDLDPALSMTKSGHTADRATAWFTGGEPGTTAEATNHIKTAQGREDDRTIRLKIKEQ